MPDTRLPGRALARLRGLCAALVMIGLVLSAGRAEAGGRGWQAPAVVIPAQAAGIIQARPHVAPRDLVAAADRDLGMGNFTGLPGAWCAWAVSAWLRATGRPPLRSGMAASALAYGPLELHPRRGDLAVMRTRRGRFGHVGIVVADLGATVEIVSGNWGHRVAHARILRRSVTAFVRV
jgi:cell wall-associated NlpC family hydrolase